MQVARKVSVLVALGLGFGAAMAGEITGSSATTNAARQCPNRAALPQQLPAQGVLIGTHGLGDQAHVVVADLEQAEAELGAPAAAILYEFKVIQQRCNRWIATRMAWRSFTLTLMPSGIGWRVFLAGRSAPTPRYGNYGCAPVKGITRLR